MTHSDDAGRPADQMYVRPSPDWISDRAISVFFIAAGMVTLAVWMPVLGWGAWHLVDALI